MDVPRDQIVQRILPYDVILGRGQLGQQHPGNVEYRRIVRDRHKEYESAPGRRDDITTDVIQIIKMQGGRFLKQVAVSSSSEQRLSFCWVQSPDSMVRAKVKQALRDTGRQASMKSAPRRSADDSPTANRYQPIITEAAKAKRNAKNFGSTESCDLNDSVQPDDSGVTLRSISTSSRRNMGSGSIRGGDSVHQGLPLRFPLAGVAAMGIPSVQIPRMAYNKLGNSIHVSSQRIQSSVTGNASFSSLSKSGLPAGVVMESPHRATAAGAVPMTTKEVLQRYAVQEFNRGLGDPSYLSASEIVELKEELQITRWDNHFAPNQIDR